MDAVPSEPTVVVTGTRTPELSQRATVKTDVVTRAEAERRGATNVGEALMTQPGVRVDPGAYGSIGGASAIQIQGFDLQRVLILEDNEPIVGDIGGAIDLANLPIGDVERIEIVTGPTSSLYGSSAIGGVVNILTAPPRPLGFAGRTRLEGRSYAGVLAQANGSYRSKDPAHAWISLDTNLFRQDGIARTPGLPDRQIPEQRRSLLGARAGLSLSERVDIRVRARWLRDHLDGLSSRLVPGLGRSLIEQPNETDRYTLHAVEETKISQKARLRLTLGRQWIDNTTASQAAGSLVGERHDRYHRMQSAEGVVTVSDSERTWVAGVRAEAETFTQLLTRVDSLSTGLVTTRVPEVIPQSLARVAAYAQLQWKLAGGKVTLLPGLRAENHSRYGGAVTPRFAVAFQPTRTVVLRASGGRGFRAPSAKELGFAFDHSSLGYRVLGNLDLRPELSWGVNADATWTPDKRFSIRGGTFANWVDDLIDIDLGAGVSQGTVVSYGYRNFGKARTFGGNLAASASLGERFRADIAYDYLWTRDDLNERPFGARPPHTVTASLRALLPWKFEGTVRWRATTDAFVSETTRSPSYETIDLRLARALWPRAQAYIGAINVADVHQDPGRIGDFRPPLGRVLYVGLRAELPTEDP